MALDRGESHWPPGDRGRPSANMCLIMSRKNPLLIQDENLPVRGTPPDRDRQLPGIFREQPHRQAMFPVKGDWLPIAGADHG
jgi:hypothetical protein